MKLFCGRECEGGDEGGEGERGEEEGLEVGRRESGERGMGKRGGGIGRRKSGEWKIREEGLEERRRGYRIGREEKRIEDWVTEKRDWGMKEGREGMRDNGKQEEN